MSARTILIAIALSAWLLASVVAFFIVAYMSFFGVALHWPRHLLCQRPVRARWRSPVGSALATSFLGAQLRAQQELSAEQRQSVRHEQSLAMQSARFFKFFGLGLMAIGLCGGLYYQL